MLSLKSILKVRDANGKIIDIPALRGPAGPKGDPYTLTETDKAEIVAAVIESLGGQPIFGVVDENNNIIVQGNLADGTYTVKYEMEDGSTVEIGDLVLGTTGPAYTNLADPTSADWQEGYRLSIGSGTTNVLEGHTTTNFIPFVAGDVLRVKGLQIREDSSSTGTSSNVKIVIYTQAKNKLAGAYGTTAANSDQCYGLSVDVNGDVSTITPFVINNGVEVDISNAAYIRFDGFLMDGYTSEDVIITVNEEIPA